MKKSYRILNYKNLTIYQNDEWFCFSLDSVILANFPKIKYRIKNIADLGTGNAVIPLILSQRTNAHIDAVEIQKPVADLALENVTYNNLNDQICIINKDMKIFSKERFNHDKYDLVLCNPPYFKVDDNNIINDNVYKAIARHEIMINIDEVLSCAFLILKEGGIFSMVNRSDRFIEILDLFSKYHFEVKYIRFVHDNINCNSSLFYIEGVKLGKPGLKIGQPFILKNENGDFTEEYKRLQNEVML